MLNRKHTIASPLILGACAFSALMILNPFEAEAKKTPTKPARPNVIVIMADDLGYADVSLYKGGRVPTPNLERLAKEGVLFTQGYVAAPICSPSRAGLITGRHPQRFGYEYNFGEGGAEGVSAGLNPSEITLAQAMKDAGYHTGLIGKWHMGSDKPYYPTNRGFDEFYGFVGGATAYIDYKSPQALIADMGPWGSMTPKRSKSGEIIEGPERKPVNNFDKYLTDDLTSQAVDFVKRNNAKPFFLYAAYNAPHTPLQVTKKYYDRFPEIKDHRMRVYTAMIAALDDGIGAIMKTLDDEGLAENTLIVFLSDNGCAGYMTDFCGCGPLRGGKTTHYEGGVRVPFVMRWPAGLPKGKVYDNAVSSLDIFPTAVAAAGGSLAQDRVYDGVDLKAFVTGKNTKMPHPELHWLRRPQASMVQGDWKLWASDDGKVQKLFNLADDPNETTNLYSKRPDKAKELSEKMAAFRSQMKEPAWASGEPVAFDMCGEHFEMPR